MIPDFFQRTFVKEIGRMRLSFITFLPKLLEYLVWETEDKEDAL